MIARLVWLIMFSTGRRGVDPYGSAETDHNLFREIPLRALPWVGFDFADNT